MLDTKNSVEDDKSWMVDIYHELVNKYAFNIFKKDNKLILEHKKIKLVQIQDSKADRELYFYLMIDYIHYLQKYRSIDININALNFDNDFNNECLHKKHSSFPMFFGFNNKNECSGLFGFRKNIDILHNGEQINLQEISIRTYSQKMFGMSIGGGIAFFMIYAYAMLKTQHIFMSTLPFLRNTMYHVGDICNYNYFTTKKRYVEVFNNYIELDIFSTLKKTIAGKEIMFDL